MKLEKTIHGVAVCIDNLGVLILGESGVGKSEIAFELLDRAHQLIADDAVILVKEKTHLAAYCSPVLQNYIHLRDLGPIDVVAQFGPQAIKTPHSIELVVELVSANDTSKPFNPISTIEIFDFKLPRLVINRSISRPIPLLIEAAVKNQQLKNLGYDANLAMTKRHHKHVNKDSTRVLEVRNKL